MEKERLIERLNFAMGKKDCLALAEQFSYMKDGIAILFELCQSENTTLSFRAAWILENTLTANLELFSLSLSKIIELLPTINNPSTQRHFSKLLNHAMENCTKNRFPKDVCQLLKKIDMEPIVETCFEWLIDRNSKPAVKAHCMDILYYLAKRYEWISEELPYVIELQIIDGTPGITNKGKKLLEELRRRR
ncbi:MAG: hypothetical protein EHM93_02510 [Bacteroidales bacterium]|nr:MAG: hypothetical protein EHM93_02510 [Bacteroidales bacterium]